MAGGRYQMSDVRWGGGVGTVEFLLKFMTAPDNIRTYAKKPGFDSKSLFLTHKYLRETGFLSLPA